MEVYFLKKLILQRSNIRGRNESQNIKLCSKQNYRSHCSFLPLHLLSPFSSTQAHSFQPRTNSSPSWPTSHLHFLVQTEAQCNNPFSFPFLFLSPTCPSLPFFFSHATSPLTTTLPPTTSPLSHHFLLFLPCKLPSPHLPITFPFFLSLFPAGSHLKTFPWLYKRPWKRRDKG